MTDPTTKLQPPQRTMLAVECLHATVVLVVVIAATAIYIIKPGALPQDLLGFVYGGAITYAGGRAGAARAALQSPTINGNSNGH